MPTNNLHSLDALLLSVRDTESNRLTQEAVTAYQAGAYRAAILSIWVAVCADIISKLKELATGGDAAALAEVKSLETWIRTKDIKNIQNFEHGLIELAGGNFEMLLPHEEEKTRFGL
jgi:pheromone shutdown protein TraB